MTPPRSAVLILVLCAFLAAPLAAGAQVVEKRYRVGVLCPYTCAVPPIAALRQGLAARGYSDGRNVTFEYRWADGNFEKFPALAAELVARQVDVIFASGGLTGS